ncbi:MAG: sn-glycerol-3-phosphate ABC transporter ATP-binding protein UgpC [Acidimicrobiales bacterium]|nr:sn-glycerol-3-phosphate ABC transporter ATP-binding protein UgpC [Acidimicrobiales bacterium]MBO0885998.1 sn-glycerol-3-phosphate ABC transporter ATP-binding protein UgpC [Acidimicrobiales bacterium]MBO0893216.1 sn-glycerol-3-phosphate ABC transporter ATP-binding protein UgpC [Acidimicrobiales bacterium]
MATVSLEQVGKVYPNGVRALSGLDLDIGETEFMVLVGPSGCGKTTALRLVAGLEDITSGTLRIGGQVMNEVSPKDRDIAMVFQNYALYPHMTVAENIGFALKLRKLPKEEAAQKVNEAAHILGLSEFLNRKPSQLSGGQRQRVAMGRAIVREPSVFLMDEPLSNLDAKLRVQMRAEVLRIQRRVGVATMYVTHDQTEAMTMGDRVAVLQSGELQQCDAPRILYDRPANLFVAAFIGSPAMNLYEAELDADGEGWAVVIGDQRLRLPASQAADRPGLSSYRGRRVVVGIRPEDLTEARETADGRLLHTEVDLVEALGSEQLVHFRIDARRVVPEGTVSVTGEDEDLGRLGLAPDTAEGTARMDPRAVLKPGDALDLAVGTEQLHLFDAETGLAIWN